MKYQLPFIEVMFLISEMLHLFMEIFMVCCVKLDNVTIHIAFQHRYRMKRLVTVLL